MIVSNERYVNVEKLMKRLRVKAAPFADPPPPPTSPIPAPRAIRAGTRAAPIPLLTLPNSGSVKADGVAVSPDHARRDPSAVNWLAKLFRRQGGQNKALLDIVAALTEAHVSLISQFLHLVGCGAMHGTIYQEFRREAPGSHRRSNEYLLRADRQPFSHAQDGYLLNQLLSELQDFDVIACEPQAR